MRIAQVPPLYEAVPPKLYGGTERVVAFLADALVELGHEVTLFGTGDSVTLADLVVVRDRAFRLDDNPLKSDVAAHLSMLHEVLRRADEFDVIHFHVDMLHLALFEKIAHRTVTTFHGRLDLDDLPRALACWPEFPYVSISDYQRRPLPGLNWIGTVHHGLPPELLRYSRGTGGYLAFLGRMSPEKGPVRAIEIAQAAGLPIKLAAKVDRHDQRYFDDVVQPLLGLPGVEFLGEIGDRDKAAFLGNAVAALFPIDWPEPFGLVMIEAMACGTPVIAWRQGSVPEVVDHGQTGFIVESVEEAVAAVDRLSELDRRTVRRIFDERFTASTMASNYLTLYQKLLREPDPMDTALSGVLA
jgi:glycosyltransferase involved in cell wall biosynthesis